MTDEVLGEIKSQLYDSVELAERLSLGGLLSCCVLIVLGMLGCCIVTCDPSNKRHKNHESLEERLSTAGSTNSLSRSPSSLTSSTMSQISMTSEHKGTMTDGGQHHRSHESQDEKDIGSGVENPVFINHGEMREKVTKI